MAYNEFERKSFDGLSLFYRFWQTDERPKGLICFIHGLGEHGGRYAHWAELLNRSGYSFLTYDLPGHGKSEGQRGHVSSFEDYLLDTGLLLDEAKDRFPVVPIFLYGHSLGGLIVSHYVLRRKPQLNGVIITALSNKTSLQEQKGKVLLAKVLGSIIPRMSMDSGLVPPTISRDPVVVTRYINDPLVHHKVTVGWGKSAIESIAWDEQHVDEWCLPVLVMHGEDDKLGYAEGSREFASKIKGDCTLKVWQGMYHELHNEPEKEQVFDFLLQWLDKHIG